VPYQASTEFVLNKKFTEPSDDVHWLESVTPEGSINDVVVDLPAGFAGDPTAVPECASPALDCSDSSQVGVAKYEQYGSSGNLQMVAVYNMEPVKGTPARFAFPTPVGPVILTPVLRSDGDWALSVHAKNLSEANPVYSSEVTLWGVPADPSHDLQRCLRPSRVAERCTGFDELGNEVATAVPTSSTAPLKPLLANPTHCDGQPDVTRIHMSDWFDAPDVADFEPDGDPDLSDPKWKTAEAESPPLTGCEALEFAPALRARPTTDGADSPTGLDVDLHIPQNDDPDGLATAHLRKTVVTLPEGLTLNPSGANGLGACSPSQIGMTSAVGAGVPSFTKQPDSCPDSSKIATVQVETPVLEDPLPGAVYVAEPHNNPFDSLLAIYISINDPETGIVGKLAGEVTPDPSTGRLTTVVDDNPQVPFEDFQLDFFGGAAAALKTPATCGKYTTASELTPWSAPQSGPPSTPSDSWQISQGANGSGCVGAESQLPHAPAFEAGAVQPLAGAHTPFVLNLRRDDGSQRFSEVTISPPPGLVGKLAGTPPCSDAALAAAASRDGKAEQAASSCPAASQVGTVHAAAGAGPTPYNAPGTAYLAGPYKGAPLSMAIVTPAVAGPFDLGTIVVRAALHIDPRTARITAKADPIPRILQGIPLDVRAVSVRLDKPQFTLNPTSCDELAVGGSLLSTLGAGADLSSRFQLAECGRLGFGPRIALRLFGKTNRGAYQGLSAVVRPQPGDANIARTVVRMPRSAFLAQEHIRTVCTRVQFAADACPKGAIYGRAIARSPLLDYALRGNVYLRSSDNKLPDLVADLRGPAHQPIRIELTGRTDSVKGALRNTFDVVPDAPVSYFRLQLFGGKKGLIVNSRDICAAKYRARIGAGAHNGAREVLRPVLRNTRCAKQRRAKRRKAKRSAHRDAKRSAKLSRVRAAG
jgi:hypothetical protein